MANPKKIMGVSGNYDGLRHEHCGHKEESAKKRGENTAGEDAEGLASAPSEKRRLLRLTRISPTFSRGVAGRTLNPTSDNHSSESLHHLGFQPPRREGLDVRLPNLRALRPGTSYRAWEIVDHGVRLTVTPRKLQSSLDGERWKLTVEIDVPSGTQWTLKNYRLLTSKTSIVQKPTLKGNRMQMVVLVEAPLECALQDARQPVQLALEVTVDGRQEIRTIALDHRCLLGDRDKRIDGPSLAHYTEKYLYDPIIDQLVERAKNIPRGSVQSEVARLKQWLGFDRSRWLSDPPDAAPGFDDEAAYILAPVETARWGGDCEDYTILLAAYLARRGFRTYTVFSRGHAWVQAASPGGGPLVDVDWLPDGKRFQVHSRALVRLRPRPSSSEE